MIQLVKNQKVYKQSPLFIHIPFQHQTYFTAATIPTDAVLVSVSGCIERWNKTFSSAAIQPTSLLTTAFKNSLLCHSLDFKCIFLVNALFLLVHISPFAPLCYAMHTTARPKWMHAIQFSSALFKPLFLLFFKPLYICCILYKKKYTKSFYKAQTTGSVLCKMFVVLPPPHS